jgi:hypothetical protein
MQVGPFAVPALLAVRADRPVTDGPAASGFLALWHTGILGPMTSQATSSPNLCACGCGTAINDGSRWARGHYRRGEGTFAPVPGPGELPPDLEELFTDELGPGFGHGQVYGSTSVHGPGPGELGGQAAELGDDPGPASLRDGPARPGPAPRPTVTNKLRRDIQAKVSMPLEIGGRVWQARDPVCGGTFVEQRPEIADALTDIICQSADLIDFFTGPAGGFMVYLKLASALWPVIELVLTHHILGHGHGQAEQPGRPAGPDLSRYADAA